MALIVYTKVPELEVKIISYGDDDLGSYLYVLLSTDGYIKYHLDVSHTCVKLT